MVQGMFISFEGIDGAGKSTHVAHLEETFVSLGRKVTRTREPGGTPLAEKLRDLVLNESMDPMTEALLVFASRREHIQNVIRPALENGSVVLCDRFTDATFAYQGGGRGFDLNILQNLELWVQGGLQPDVTVWFDLPAEVASARLQQARLPDKFESQPLEFFRRVANGYSLRQVADPTRFIRLNADQTHELVWTDLVAGLTSKGFLP
jgi:dTMP kinase